jgi:alkylhydroperoxidase family enzyme
MARIDIPGGEGLEAHRMWRIDPELGDPAWALREAVFNKGQLPMRIREAVRYMISLSSQCPICLAYRSAEASQAGVTERFYAEVSNYRDSDEFDKRERLALEFTDLFCRDHLAISDELFEQLRANFTEVELFDLCVTAARHLGFSRLSQVLKLDIACTL